MKIEKNVQFVTSNFFKNKGKDDWHFHNLLEEVQSECANDVDFNNQDEEGVELIIIDSMLYICLIYFFQLSFLNNF